ncbi:Fungal Zn2Cys6 Cluster domain [Entomophthora muscae]|uniref:Fungal Zn2Cys6 Cluster domain n=1 Tax=Entomophthora muscae TaxID=34485 RepID=A0ACC2RYQ5_9FUNG|nr:Fungal Zn2Cys6 Cluster domain [Entomophthora muscae]
MKTKSIAKRATVACDLCHRRKVKCVLGDNGCEFCLSMHVACTFTKVSKRKRTGIRSRLVKAQWMNNIHVFDSFSEPNSNSSPEQESWSSRAPKNTAILRPEFITMPDPSLDVLLETRNKEVSRCEKKHVLQVLANSSLSGVAALKAGFTEIVHQTDSIAFRFVINTLVALGMFEACHSEPKTSAALQEATMYYENALISAQKLTLDRHKFLLPALPLLDAVMRIAKSFL